MSYYQDRSGYHTSFIASHFKNDSLKGDQELPLSQLLIMPLTLLEKGIHACFSSSPTLFFGLDGQPYKGTYFSTIASKCISFGGHHLTANDVRHMFVTLWKDFLSSPSTQLLDLTIQQLSACAADLMLNSTNAWSIAYDESTRSRAINTTLVLWPQFVAFVHEAHLDAMSKKEWDPITIDPSLLSPTST